MAGMLTAFTAPQLATLATAYVAATNTTLASVGQQLFNDHRFFKRLVLGLDCTTENAAKASRWLVENWPEGALWPVDVPRPDSRARGRVAA